jgi:hypothetical protein
MATNEVLSKIKAFGMTNQILTEDLHRIGVAYSGNARSSVESNDSRVTSLYDAFFRLTTPALDELRVFNSSMRTGISL